VSIEISGPVSAAWYLVRNGGEWEFSPTPGPVVAATMSMTTDQAWRLLSNNLPAAEQRHIALTGDERLLRVLRQTRAIIGAPR
jgi:hypothetical protein